MVMARAPPNRPKRGRKVNFTSGLPSRRVRAPINSSEGRKLMKVTLYHNPKCGTSRNVLDIIRAKGIEPTIVEYLKTPLSKAELAALIKKMGVPVKDVVRWKEKDTLAEAGIREDSSDAKLLDAMARHPILMNRPIVVTPKAAKLCRPSETVAEIL